MMWKPTPLLRPTQDNVKSWNTQPTSSRPPPRPIPSALAVAAHPVPSLATTTAMALAHMGLPRLLLLLLLQRRIPPRRKLHCGCLDTTAPSCPVRHAIARRRHARQVFDETPAGGSAYQPPCLRWPCQPAPAVLVNSIPSHNCAATPRWYFIPSSTVLTSFHLVRAAVPLQWDGHSDPSISML